VRAVANCSVSISDTSIVTCSGGMPATNRLYLPELKGTSVTGNTPTETARLRRYCSGSRSSVVYKSSSGQFGAPLVQHGRLVFCELG
jgi:hypothetical protein